MARKISNEVVEQAVDFLLYLKRLAQNSLDLNPRASHYLNLNNQLKESIKEIFQLRNPKNLDAGKFDEISKIKDLKEYYLKVNELNHNGFDFTIDVSSITRVLENLKPYVGHPNNTCLISCHRSNIDGLLERLNKEKGFGKFGEQNVSLDRDTFARLMDLPVHGHRSYPLPKKRTSFWNRIVVGGLVLGLLAGAGIYNRRGDTPQNSQSTAKKLEQKVLDPKTSVGDIFSASKNPDNNMNDLKDNEYKKGDYVHIVKKGEFLTGIIINFINENKIKVTNKQFLEYVNLTATENGKRTLDKSINPDGTLDMAPGSPHLLFVGERLKLNSLYELLNNSEVNNPNNETLQISQQDFDSILFERYLSARKVKNLDKNQELDYRREMRSDLGTIVNDYNKTGKITKDYAWAPTSGHVRSILNFERYKRIQQRYNPSEGPYLGRFNYKFLSNPEKDMFFSLYSNSSLSVAEIKETFERGTEMGISKTTISRYKKKYRENALALAA